MREPEGLDQERISGQERHPSPKATCVLGRPRRSASSSRAGRSSWTSEKVCTSSTAAAAGSARSTAPPAASATARQSTGRIRFPSALERVSKRLLEAAEFGCERERAEIRLDCVPKLVSRPHPRSSRA